LKEIENKINKQFTTELNAKPCLVGFLYSERKQKQGYIALKVIKTDGRKKKLLHLSTSREDKKSLFPNY
jgi:DNA polymerase-3 subunit epsilon